MAAEPIARGLAKRPWCDDRDMAVPDLWAQLFDLQCAIAALEARLDDDGDRSDPA